MDKTVIFTKKRDPRLITMRRGGTLQDSDHHLLAEWAADCAQRVLHFFEQAHLDDDRPRRAIELARTWARGEITLTQSHIAAYAIRAVRAAASESERIEAGRGECRWQREQLPDQIRKLVLDDQRLRNEKCWYVFDC